MSFSSLSYDRSPLQKKDEIWARNVYLQSLRQKYFLKWRIAQQQALPFTRGSAVYAGIKWIAIVFDREKQSPFQTQQKYEFPFYAAREHDGSASRYFLSRLRSYLLDKLEIPVDKLPLFTHTIALLDAFMLKRMFRGWKALCRFARQLDQHYRVRNLTRALRHWHIWWRRRDVYRAKRRVLTFHRHEHHLQHFFGQWKALFKAAYFHRNVSRGWFCRRRGVKQLQCHTWLVKWQRFVGVQGQLHCEKTQKKRVLRTLLQSLCPLAKADHLLDSKQLQRWILNILHIQAVTSLHAQRSWQTSIQYRSRFYLNYPLLRHFFGGAAQEGLPRVSGEQKEQLRQWIQVLKVIQTRRRSRKSQLFTIRSATLLYWYRRMHRYLRRWMLRVPQRVLDCPTNIAIFATMKQYAQQSRSNAASPSRVLFSSPIRSSQPDLWWSADNLRRHRVQHALSKWHRVTSTRRYLRRNFLLLHLISNKRDAMKALGAWVMVAARFKMLHAAENRIVCNQIQKQLWFAWFAWRNQYERSVLIRQNQKQLIALRNAEINEYVSLQRQRHQEDLQYSVLKSWAKFVRRRQQGKKLEGIVFRYYGRDNVYHCFHRWKTILALDYIVNTVKTLWHGYNVRFLQLPQFYRHLKWYRSRVPSMLQFARQQRIQRNFARWKSLLAKSLRYAEHRRRHVALKTAMHTLWRLLIRGRRFRHKRMRIAASSYQQKYSTKCLQRWHFTAQLHKLHRVLSEEQFRRFSSKKCLRHWLAFAKLQHKKARSILTHRRRELQSHFAQWAHIARYKQQGFKKAWLCWRQSRLRQYLQRWRRFRSAWSFLCRHDSSRQLFPKATDTSYSLALRNALARHGNFGRAGAGLRPFLRPPRSEANDTHFDHFGHSLTSRRGYCSVSGRKALQHWRSLCSTKQRLQQHYNDKIRTFVQKKLKRAFRYLFVNWRQGLLRQYKYRGGKRVLQHSRVPRVAEGESESRRKYRHLVSQMLKKRVRKQSTFAENSFAVACFRSFQMWQFSTAQHYRRKRLHALKQHHFRCYKLRRALFRWQFWAQKHGKSARLTRRTAVKYQRRLLSAALHCLQRNRARQLRSSSMVKTFLNSKKDKIAMRYFLIKRWFFAVQKKKYRKYRKQKYGIVPGSGGGLVCIAKLRKRCAHFIEKLRLMVLFRRQARRAQLPTWKQPVLVIEKKSKERLRLQFDRMKKRLATRKYRHLIISLVNSSHREMKMKAALRFWRQLVHWKRQLRRVARRMCLVPSLRSWHRSYRALTRHTQIFAIMQRRQRTRILSLFVKEWRHLTRREVVLRGKFEIVQGRHRRWEKTRVMYAWLVVLDNSLLRQRYDEIQAKHAEKLRLKCFTHWHTLALLSEMHTYKNLRTCLHSWRDCYASLKRQRLSLHKGEVYHNSVSCHRALQQWYTHARRQHYMAKRRHVAFKRYLKHGLLRAFRCWKRRMHIKHRQSVTHLAQQQHWHYDEDWFGGSTAVTSALGRRIHTMARSTLGHSQYTLSRLDKSRMVHGEDADDRLVLRAEMHRTLLHLHKYAKRRAKRRRDKTLTKIVSTWRAHTRAQSLLRQAFAARFAALRRKELLALVWRSFHSVWHSKKVLENMTQLHSLHVKHRTLKTWFAQKQVVLHHKATMKYVLHCIYKFQVLRCFLTWKVRATIAQRLHKSILCTHVWQRWNSAFKAIRFRRLLLLLKTLNAWKGLIRWYRNRNELFFLRRRKLYDMMCVQLSRERYLLKRAFTKWQRGDMSAKFTEFCQLEDERQRAAHYQSQLGAVVPGAAVLLSKTLGELAKSQAARILLLQDVDHNVDMQDPDPMGVSGRVLWTEEEIAQCRSRQPFIKIPRSAEILAHFRSHCSTVLETQDMQRSKSAKIRERLSQSNRFEEEKLNYDNIPLREKMSIATSPQRSRRSRSPFIGLRPSASIVKPPTSYDSMPLMSFGVHHSSSQHRYGSQEDDFFLQEPTTLGDDSLDLASSRTNHRSRIHLQELM